MSRRFLDDVLNRFFNGSARALVSQLLESEKLDPEEIKAIRRDVNRRIKE
jgi:predicted transcriptional regulator